MCDATCRAFVGDPAFVGDVARNPSDERAISDERMPSRLRSGEACTEEATLRVVRGELERAEVGLVGVGVTPEAP